MKFKSTFYYKTIDILAVFVTQNSMLASHDCIKINFNS